MIFTATKLAGAFLIDLVRKEDVRGYFARVFCTGATKESTNGGNSTGWLPVSE